ncbi:hypothetical protein HII31_04109 [Pseudocercospora fuligena]|uniref:Fucose-specific lectin n=1 Tax=Pseudocercospora fuligena TaxID=685502 RepID=A0A8H6RPL6_9PEZI|nr:hypothetical protein HII31_04109 [Pseudocercospora fuligena]
MDSPPSRIESPPPRFSESGTGTPRFTEHFNASPPYQQCQNFEGEQTGVPQYGQTQEGTVLGSHRLSDKERPYSPTELVSPMPETYRSDNEEKEVVIPPLQPEAYQRPEERPQKRRRICGIPPLWFFIALAAVIILAIALGVGLGVGLNNDKSSDSDDDTQVNTDYLIGGAISPEYYTTSGAFNGSGIALAQQSFSRELQDGNQGSLVMYFQHWTGEIRYKQLSNDGAWIGGDYSAIVAQDAKNSTPLSAVSYVLNESSTWHVFYIDQNNTLKQRSNSNTTNVWEDGPINDLNLKVFDADTIGMQACWYGNDYGDSDYAHTPLPNESPQANKSHEVGMHMWYASDNNTFQQYGWRDGDDSWEHQGSWPDMNGHAGVGCYSWGPGTVTYVMFVNAENTVEFWWKDTNTNLTNTTTHPINAWTNATGISIPNVHPSTSLGYTNAFYAQLEDLYIHGFNISWAAENTSMYDPFEVGGPQGLPGTHMSVTALPNNSGGSDLLVFYQTNGSAISEYTRDIIAGQWAQVEIDIPS